MSEDGYVVGFPELYSEIKILSGRLTEYMSKQDLISAAQEHRINELTKDLEGMQTKLDSEKEQRTALTKQFWFSLLSSLILPILVMVAGGWIIAKGN